MFWNFILIFYYNVFLWAFACSLFLICTREGCPKQSIYFALSSALFEWKVPWEFPVAMQWPTFFRRLFFSFYREYILFCHGNFSFTVTYFFFAGSMFLLPRDFLFCGDYLSFVAEISVLPRDFFFFRDVFLFCSENFCFASSFLLLSWLISFLPRASFFWRGNFYFVGSFFIFSWLLWATFVFISVWWNNWETRDRYV